MYPPVTSTSPSGQRRRHRLRPLALPFKAVAMLALAGAAPLVLPQSAAAVAGSWTGGAPILLARDINVVEEVTPDGMLSVIAGNGGVAPATLGPAIHSQLDGPVGVAVDSAGNVYIADFFNSEVEKVTPDGTLSVLAGTGGTGPPTLGGPATDSKLAEPQAVAVAPRWTRHGDRLLARGSRGQRGARGRLGHGCGNVYIADTKNNDVEEVVTPAPPAPPGPLGPSSTATGTGSAQASGANGPAAAAGTGGKTAPAAPTAGKGTALVGRSVVSVSIPVTCPARSPRDCTVTGTITTTTTTTTTTPGQAGARASRRGPDHAPRPQVIGRAEVTLAPRHTGYLTISLDRGARRLLAKRGVLHARLIVTATGKVIRSRPLTFVHKPHNVGQLVVSRRDLPPAVG
jgi:hypothetical protein